MAVTKVPESAKIIFRVENGVSATGKALVRQLSLKGLKPEATDADVFEVAQALANLQAHAVVAIARQDESTLVNA